MKAHDPVPAAMPRADAKPAVGEAWAYRARAADPLVQVVVLRIGVRSPSRLLVRFVDDDFEGKQDWVPPARLKVPWPDAAAYSAWEARWAAVLASSPAQDSFEESAVSVVFDVAVDPALATLGDHGEALIADVAGLAARLDLEPDVLTGDPTSFEEDGAHISPWAVAMLVAQRAAQRDPDAILRYVARDEADARRDAVHGRHYPGRGKNGGWSVSPEDCARIDEEHGSPMRALLRQWCGAEAVGLREELDALRKEIVRLTRLGESAVAELRRANAHRIADRLHAELTGEPVKRTRAKSRRTGPATT